MELFEILFRQRVQHGLSYLFEIINQIMLSKSESMPSVESGLVEFSYVF